MTTEEILRILLEADSAAHIQERAGNEGDADAIRRDAIRRILERVAPNQETVPGVATGSSASVESYPAQNTGCES